MQIISFEQWSPEQISGYLAKSGRWISHETIYRIIRKDKARGGDFIGKIRSITTDNGLEFARHEVISQKLGVPIFFADPYSSW